MSLPLSLLPTEEELTEEELAKFEDLCTQKIKIVEERDELVNQTEEERLRSVTSCCMDNQITSLLLPGWGCNLVYFSYVRQSDHCTFTCTHQVHVNVQ